MPDSEYDEDFSQEPKGEVPDNEADKETENPLAEAQKTFFDALRDLKQNLDNNESEMVPPEGQDVPNDPTGNPQDSGNSEREDKSARAYMSSKSTKAGEDDDTVIPGRGNSETAENIKRIMRVLEGNFQKSMAKKDSHPGGSPRKWKRMSSFDELEDIDPVEAFIWSENTSPMLPRAHLREKEMLGGEIAILRDISTSMMGVYSEWSSSVVKGVIELARRKRMRIGYLEFNHRPKKHTKNSRFFTRDYRWIENLAEKTDCSGNTNYENALGEALREFRGRGLRNKHILFITDGIPTSGDPEVKKQRERAKSIGVCVHSIFIGSKNYPQILEKISRETVGTQFVASKGRDEIIRIQRKDKAHMESEKERMARSRHDAFGRAFKTFSGPVAE